MEATNKKTTSSPKKLEGVVVSVKMKDTCVVSVEDFSAHAKYGKFIKRSKRFSVHDEGNKAKLGDKVVIIETRPMSKTKHFAIHTISKAQ